MKKNSRRIKTAIILVFLMILSIFQVSCGTKNAQNKYRMNTSLDTTEEVKIVIVGSWKERRGIDLVAQKFHEVYPNCTVKYERLQDYNNTLPKRLLSENDRADLFITSNIQEGSQMMDYTLDLLQYSEVLDLSDTFTGLVDNFKYIDSSDKTHLYSIPMCAEMRGLYVNITLLSSLGISVPQNRSEFLDACEKLKAAGYIPLQDNPGTFGQRLLFPYIAHLVSVENTASDSEKLFATCSEEAIEVLEDPIDFLYQLISNGYYNYKVVETEYQRFLDISNDGMARSFLNIVGSDDEYQKKMILGKYPLCPDQT